MLLNLSLEIVYLTKYLTHISIQQMQFNLVSLVCKQRDQKVIKEKKNIQTFYSQLCSLVLVLNRKSNKNEFVL